MTTKFPRLFEPIDIKGVRIPNRLVMTAHGTFYDSLIEQPPGDRYGHYLAARARGGVGLIVAPGAAVVYSAGEGRVRFQIGEILMKTQRGLSPPDVVGWLRKRNQVIIKMVHDEGAKIFGQLRTGGGRVHLAGQRPTPGFMPVSSSQVPDIRSGMMPHELDVEEIGEIIRLCGEAAKFTEDCGFDGMEFRGHAGYLVQQFLSPLSNKRTDRYGGGLENRMRFLVEALEEVRANVGSDFPVGLRLGIEEHFPGGQLIDESVAMVDELARLEIVDYLSVSAGILGVQGWALPDMSYPPGFLRSAAGKVRRAARGIPVLVVGRINHPTVAEQILEKGHADLIGMTRALIADPEFGVKAKRGDVEDIRPCVGANDGCTSHILWGFPITCVHNPAAGLEKYYPKLQPASPKKRVLVVGGGPAGLKTAEVMAERGHGVELWEKEKELGGQVLLQAKVPSRSEYGGIAEYMVHQLRRLSVSVRLGIEATPENIRREGFDAVVVATGSVPHINGYTNLAPELPSLPGSELPHVCSEVDILRGAPFGKRVVVVDDSEGDYKAPVVAEYMSQEGSEVTLCTTADLVGGGMPDPNRGPLLTRLLKSGVKILTSTGVNSIQEHSVTTYSVYSYSEASLDDVDTVVLVLAHKSQDGLFHALKGHVETHRVGDCLAPRGVREAITDGFLLGIKV